MPDHNKSTKQVKRAGFTLVELLVVIAIIGLLGSIVLVSLNSARTKARDARRKADLNQLSLALELYYDSHNGYPDDTFNGWEQPCKTTTNDIGKIVTEGFIAVLPCDPINSGSGGSGLGYYFDPEDSAGVPCSGGFCPNYCLKANLEGGGRHFIVGGTYPSC